MERRRKHTKLLFFTIFAFVLLPITTAVAQQDTTLTQDTPYDEETSVSVKVAEVDNAPQVVIDGLADAPDTKPQYVEKALDILRKLDPSLTRYRRGKSAAGLELRGANSERPRGVVGLFGYYLKQVLQLILLHNPESLEEPVGGRSPLAGGSIKEGRHARQLRTAVEALDIAAEAGNPDAIYLLAQMNFYGNWSHPRNYKTAFNYYKRLADDTGNSTAQFMVGFLYATGFGGAVERDQGKALLYHTFASLNGDTRSEMTVAFRHHTGIGTPRNCDTAAFHYKRVADKAMEFWRSGPPGGRYTVRHSYRLADDEGGVYGEGASYISSGMNKAKRGGQADTAENLEDILEYWDLMARKGNVLTTYTLGKMYYEGSRNMPRNLQKAKAYFMSIVNRYWAPNGKIVAGAPQGMERYAAKAAGQLGKMYLRGDGVPQSYEQAIMWFERGVVRGDYYSQNGLGYMYLHGLGKPKDRLKAAEYFDAAASQDFAPAQVNLGKLLLEQGDFADAKKYFELAARHGNVESYYYLAEIFNSGKDRERSCGMATAYYKIVAERIENIHSNIEWANKAYAEGDIESALVGYLMAAEQGYEAAQQNVAYILDDQKVAFSVNKIIRWVKKKFGNQPNFTSANGTTSAQQSPLFRNREMALIYWTRSAKQSNTDSLVKMGDYYLAGIGTEEDREKAAACYQAASEFQQSGQALWDLGWMYENRIGVEQDFHLAKRFYDQALETNPQEAYLPIKLSLLKLQVRSLWNTLTRGGVNDIGEEPDIKPKKPWSLRGFLKKWNEEVEAANAAAAAQAAQQEEHNNAMQEEISGEDINGDARHVRYDDEEVGDEDLVESVLILVLATAVILLIWYRQQRQLQQQQQGQQGQQGVGVGAGAGVAGAAGGGVFPEPGGLLFGIPPLP